VILAIGVTWIALACATILGVNLAKRHYRRKP
jgi:hypothetical protein